jgi:hypothetical protein
VHNHEYKVKNPKQKIILKENAWCLPCSREERLVLVKLGVPSWSTTVLGPIQHDASMLIINDKE